MRLERKCFIAPNKIKKTPSIIDTVKDGFNSVTDNGKIFKKADKPQISMAQIRQNKLGKISASRGGIGPIKNTAISASKAAKGGLGISKLYENIPKKNTAPFSVPGFSSVMKTNIPEVKAPFKSAAPYKGFNPSSLIDSGLGKTKVAAPKSKGGLGSIMEGATKKFKSLDDKEKLALAAGTTLAVAGTAYLAHRHNKKKQQEQEKLKAQNSNLQNS